MKKVVGKTESRRVVHTLYLQIYIRNNLFISQFVDSKFCDLLICKCVQNDPTGRVGSWQKSKTWQL